MSGSEKGLAASFVICVVAFIAYAVWNVATCEEWGPPKTEWVTSSCGDNCWSTVPVETKQCVRRKP